MKNLNKKIGAVALAAMMVAGGVAVSGIKVQAAGGGPIIDNRPNAEAHRIVKEICDRNGMEIVESSVNENEIESFIKKKIEAKGYKELAKKLRDRGLEFEREEVKEFEDYLKSRKQKALKNKSANKLIRVKFWHEQYIILLNK